jgi:hypothetical protein
MPVVKALLLASVCLALCGCDSTSAASSKEELATEDWQEVRRLFVENEEGALRPITLEGCRLVKVAPLSAPVDGEEAPASSVSLPPR